MPHEFFSRTEFQSVSVRRFDGLEVRPTFSVTELGAD